MGFKLLCKCQITTRFMNREPCNLTADAEDGLCNLCRGHYDGQVVTPNTTGHHQGIITFAPSPRIVQDDEEFASLTQLETEPF